jgi:hypothetical protein
MQHVEAQLPGERGHAAGCKEVGDADFAPDGKPMQAEFEVRLEFRQLLCCQGITVVGTDDGYGVAAGSLFPRKIAHVPEETADRRTQTLKDAKPGLHVCLRRLLVWSADQNQRSKT